MMKETRHPRRPATLKLILAMMLLVCGSAICQSASPASIALPSLSTPAARLWEYADLAVQWEQEYLRIDTTNPPGNEARAAAFFKKVFDAEGIENQVLEFAPGRANIIATLRHDPAGARGPAQRPLILLSHEDVVTSDPAHWKFDPFSAAIDGPYLYGRGAQDMKSEGLAQLVVMVMLKREKVPLDRDIIFLATADEEVDGIGTDWMIAHHRDLLNHAEFLITEGGENLRVGDAAKFIGVDVGEKSPFWLRVTAHGIPGHGSRPRPDTAPNRLVRALQPIIQFKPELKLLPVVEEFLRDMAQFQTGDRAEKYRNARRYLQDKTFYTLVENDIQLGYMLRNTVSLTMLGGSKQTNVIPGEAWANLDVRLLPGEDRNQFLRKMRSLVTDPQVSIEPQEREFRVANSSSTDTALFRAFRQVEAKYHPGAPVVPVITSGYTENQRYREIGISSYGFSPYTASPEESATEHGDNERIRLSELRTWVRNYCSMWWLVLQGADGRRLPRRAGAAQGRPMIGYTIGRRMGRGSKEQL